MSALVLRAREGTSIPLEIGRWRAAADAVERDLVAGLPDSVIDIGCGPGRMVEAVAASGRRALGIDPSPRAADEAAARGVPVLRRSVFDPLPGEGRWGAALLLDGNVGIGGDPAALLRRVGELLGPGGVLVAEVEPPGVPDETFEVRIERATGDGGAAAAAPGPWFRWARVGVDGIASVMDDVGLALGDVVCVGGRWLAHGVRP
jgi:SAM-dependent methyltransferase